MNNLTDLNTHYNILSQARYLTDLSITPKGDSKSISLRWYAKIPLVGRAVSYIRYLSCHPGIIQRQLLELSQKHENDFKASMVKFLDTEDNWGEGVDKIYRHYTLLQQLFSQISHLPGSKCALKIDWANFLQESTFTQATLALDQLDTKTPNARKIAHFHALMKKIDATAQILQRTAPVVDKQSMLENLGDTRLFRYLKDKSQQILRDLSPLNPLEQFLMCNTSEVLELTIELAKLIKHPFFAGTFSAAYQEFNQIYQRLQPDITQVPQELLLKHLQGLSLDEILHFAKDYPATCEMVEPIIRNKAAEVKSALIQRLQEALQHDADENKWWDMRIFLTNDETFSQMIPKDMRTILWSDLISPKELQAAMDALKNIANSPYSKLSIIDKLEKVYNLHKSLKESNWQIDFQDKAQEFKAILDLYDSYDVKYDTFYKLKTKATTILQAIKGLQDWKQLKTLKEIGGVKSLRKELLQSIDDKRHVDEYLPTLIEEFKSLCKQLYRSFEDLAPESRHAYISSLSNQQLYRFAEKNKAYEKDVEQELAQRVPGIYGKLLTTIKAQLTASPKAKVVADKLTQMEMETIKQVKPANVQEVLDYLNSQRDTLARILGMAPREVISSIKLPCLERIMSQFDEDAYASTMDECYSHCSIHQGLKQAFVWNIYYSLQTEFNVPDFDNIFKPMLKKEPLMAVQMILWNPRDTDMQLWSARQAIQTVLATMTSKHGTPFDLLPEGGIKSDFVQLASHLERNTHLATLSPALAPYHGKWAALEIEINGWLKGKRNNLVQFSQLRDAAGFISTSKHFEENHPELFKAAQVFCFRCTPELANIATEHVFKLIGAAENGDKRNYPLLPLRRVCKEWNVLIERKIALEMPAILVSLTDRFAVWVDLRDEFKEREPLKLLFIDEIKKLNPPSSLEEAKDYWERVHLTVLKHFQETLALTLYKKDKIPKSVLFPCLSSLIMGNIGNGKQNSTKLTCCPIHRVFSGGRFLKEYETYMANPDALSNLSMNLDEILLGLSKVDFDKMMSMALMYWNKGHRNGNELLLYRILEEATTSNWHGQWSDEFSSLVIDLFSQFEPDINEPVSDFLLNRIQDPDIKEQTLLIICKNYQKRSDKFKQISEYKLKYYAAMQKGKYEKKEKTS